MSTSIEYVVDTEASLEEAPHLAEYVLSVLLQKGIVLPTPQVHPFILDPELLPRHARG